jgi:cold shock CspA family protein
MGRIVFYHPRKQFGFVRATDANDYFFHQIDFEPGEFTKLGEVKLGQMIVFKLGQPISLGKRVQATNIRLAGPAEIEIASGVAALAGGI